jgi:peptidoglycan-associated lipoprotein
MRPTARIAMAAIAGLSLVLALAPGCASRKKVTTAQVEPPPPAPTETKTETPPPAPSQPSTQTEERLSLADAFFDFDDYALRADAKAALDQNAKYLEKNGDAKIVIEGHCDERGSVEYNLALGEKRARAAKDYLVSYGISGPRMTTISYGKERPFDSGHDESAWSKNRRAHFASK